MMVTSLEIPVLRTSSQSGALALLHLEGFHHPSDQHHIAMSTMSRNLRSLVFFLLLGAAMVVGEEAANESPPIIAEEKPVIKEEVVKPKEPAFNAQDHTDWGTYHDTQNIFCGKFDCYRILGFDYEEFGKDIPDTKVITKRYRSLSREWHPDKSKHKDAKERFVKIARAYEVLTDKKVRKEYDFMRYNQEAYFQKYGASVLWSYAPKSDATMIIFFILVLANLFTWIAQKTRWQNVADRLIKAAVEDWSPSMGGSPESKQLREEALEMLAEQQKKVEEDAADASAAAPAATEGKSKAKKIKVSAKEKKQQEMENVKPIITELVSQVKDFGAGFHYPTWRDLMIVRLAKFPVTLTVGILWQTKYLIRRLQKKELNDEEHSVLTERAVGNVAWELSDEEGKQEMIKRELWKMENLVKWKEELELKNMSKADQKYHKMMMKKKGSKAE